MPVCRAAPLDGRKLEATHPRTDRRDQREDDQESEENEPDPAQRDDACADYLAVPPRCTPAKANVSVEVRSW